ncbi:TlpA family protein disulfide reductase [Candidatus Colwellia aromaticivorans]|uniref:TlpA family protein disulfide reductase n=1 Tax=Candidatus Colwellia aromaticivorans TaxID=2267621 RepID=UPI001FE749CD|nr:TlpA disulfide reductase family protein [Candidatus Colwellia aromaticivorans]
MLATLRSLGIQVLLFFIVFQAISFFRETSMLSTDVELSASKSQSFTQVPTLMGDSVSLNSEGKTTVLYFFAPWCQICHISIGNLQTLYEKNEHLEVVAVAMDYTSIEEVLDFTKQHQLTFPIALGNEEIKHAFSISGFPSYYVINEENTIIGKSMGYSSELGLYLRSL